MAKTRLSSAITKDRKLVFVPLLIACIHSYADQINQIKDGFRSRHSRSKLIERQHEISVH